MKKSTQENDKLASLHADSVEVVREYKAKMKQERKSRDSFSAQEVDINQYILSPEGWESVILTLYILFIPYVVGMLFLFVFIAEVAFDKFLLLDMSSILVIWAIGYEVIAITLLFLIFLSFISYLNNSKTKSKITINNPHRGHN